MDAKAFLEQYIHSQRYRGQIVKIIELPPRPAQFGELSEPLSVPVMQALAANGIQRLYIHQIQALQHLRAGRHVVIVTGPASGKTLCYTIPVLEAILQDPLTTALFLYPTKALAQDQLRTLEQFMNPQAAPQTAKEAGKRRPQRHKKRSSVADEFHFIVAGTYDGDTPPARRRTLREKAQIILSNPDMLHQAILPHHERWARFFHYLRFVVIDEIHAYRGVFGSHFANVLRRLQRICQHYGSAPQFICCSATIANPVEHATRLIGQPIELVNEDGAPRGPKRFVLWNPPILGETARERQASRDVPNSDVLIGGGERRSPLSEAIELLTNLVRSEIQTIAFVRTRLAAELICRGAREHLEFIAPRLAEAVAAYRGGYLPEERRAIEQKLASGELWGVASTNALELGIDIGSLDACLIVGYPGTIASLWQQAGRAGRGEQEALVFLIADNAPIDQYLMQHPEYLFQKNPEQAVIDPDNPHVAIGHLKCALRELPLKEEEIKLFGEYAEPIMEILAEEGLVRHRAGKWHWKGVEYPAKDVNLRHIGGPVYNIQDVASDNRIIGTMDEIGAFSQLHKNAVYLHDAQTYLVTDLDIEHAVAYVERRDLDYYTQALTSSRLLIQEKEEEKPWRGGTLGLGLVSVTTIIPMFKKIRYHSRESLGFERLELPPQLLETIAMWLVLPDAYAQQVRRYGLVPAEGLVGIANCLVEVAPMFVMCDVQDIGSVVDASNLGKDALFIYDRYPGGLGYAMRCLDAMDELIAAVHDVISHCSCEEGCPSCVGAAMPPFAMTDLDSGTRGRIPNKEAALVITHALLGLEPYVPKARSRPINESEISETTYLAPEAPEQLQPSNLRKRLWEIEQKKRKRQSPRVDATD